MLTVIQKIEIIVYLTQFSNSTNLLTKLVLCSKRFISCLQVQLNYDRAHVRTVSTYDAKFINQVLGVVLHTYTKGVSDKCDAKFKHAKSLKRHMKTVHSNAEKLICEKGD